MAHQCAEDMTGKMANVLFMNKSSDEWSASDAVWKSQTANGRNAAYSGQAVAMRETRKFNSSLASQPPELEANSALCNNVAFAGKVHGVDP